MQSHQRHDTNDGDDEHKNRDRGTKAHVVILRFQSSSGPSANGPRHCRTNRALADYAEDDAPLTDRASHSCEISHHRNPKEAVMNVLRISSLLATDFLLIAMLVLLLAGCVNMPQQNRKGDFVSNMASADVNTHATAQPAAVDARRA